MSDQFSSVTQPDIRLTLDLDGVIRNAVLSHAIVDEAVEPWFGRFWRETVGLGGDQVSRVLAEARATGVSSFAQVTQQFPSGRQLPIEYTTVHLGEPAGLVAIGKSLLAVTTLQSRLLATQQAREQEYWKLREVETRYRLLFDASNEAVVLLHAETMRILEINPAGVRAFGFGSGDAFDEALAATERGELRATLAQARDQGRAPAMIVHLGPEQGAWVLRPSLMTAESGPTFLLHLVQAGEARQPATPRNAVSLDELAERLPDALIVIDQAGIVRRVNAAFLDLVQANSQAAVLGEKLATWLYHPGCDVGVILQLIERHRVVRRLATTVYGSVGIDTAVEISAVGSSDIRPLYVALVVRNVERRPVDVSAIAANAPLVRADRHRMTAELGRTPLLKLVQDATSVIERDYIAAALEKAAGNRSAAAELLGLSRQTLYVKLGRYGLDEANLQLSGRLN